MFEAIYILSLKRDSFDQYKQLWKNVAQYMVNHRSAVESKIYFSEQSNCCLIHSRWPSEFFQKKNWPLSNTAPIEVRDSVDKMREYRASEPEQLYLNLSEVERLIKEKNLKLSDHVESKRKQILLYNDEGCGQSIYEILERLKQTVNLSCYRLLVVDAEYINKIDWESKTQLFIMPGGRARPYYLSLGATWEKDTVDPGEMRKLKDIGEGNRRIKHFVEQHGGHYLGICAGAYYGADKTVFERGGELEVLDEGPLKFFSGAAEGPAYGLGKFDYHSEAGAEIAEIQSQKIPNVANLSVYFNGGCFLHTEGQETPTENILAYYSNIQSPEKGKNPIAIVETQCGHGTAILSGVHFEHSSLSPDKDIARLQKLAAQDDER